MFDFQLELLTQGDTMYDFMEADDHPSLRMILETMSLPDAFPCCASQTLSLRMFVAQNFRSLYGYHHYRVKTKLSDELHFVNQLSKLCIAFGPHCIKFRIWRAQLHFKVYMKRRSLHLRDLKMHEIKNVIDSSRSV